MHILLIHQAFCGPQDPGGTRHYELALRLSRLGHRFTVVTSKFSYLTGEKKTATPNDGEIDMRIASTLGSWHRSYVQRLVAFVSFMVTSVLAGLRVDEPEVVIGTSPPIFQALSAWMVSAIRRCPFVMEVRDLWPDFAVDLGLLRNPVLIFLARRLELFLYARADHIIVNSPSYQNYLSAKGVQESNISVIPNGVDVSAFCVKESGEVFRRENGLVDKFVIMYAGAIGHANDVDCLLRAATRLLHRPEIVFAIVGDGKEVPRLRREADSHHLSNVRFIPAEPKQQMPRTLAAADVCVAALQDAPMLHTTYPNKVFDYMAAGRPTVLAIDGAIREVIEESRGGIFVPPGDDAALAEAILALYRSPALRKEMGANARSYVTSHFDRGLQAAQMADVLLRYCSMNSLRPRDTVEVVMNK